MSEHLAFNPHNSHRVVQLDFVQTHRPVNQRDECNCQTV